MSIVIAHATLVLMLDVLLVIREVLCIESVLEVRSQPLDYSDVLNPRLLR